MPKMDMDALVGIHSVNSIDFVKAVFAAYHSGEVLVVLKESKCDLTLRREITPAAGGGWLDIPQEVIVADRSAQIVFSSGTEGAPKAILLSHRALADVVIRLNDTMKLDDSISEYVGIPVTYSFGLGRCRAVAAAGGRCFVPTNGFNPTELTRMLAANEINAISTVPTLWRTVLAQPEVIGDYGRRVKWIEIGSQYMSRSEKERMKVLFPNAIIVQHYGLTEASRTTFLAISDTEGEHLSSVGQAAGKVEVKLSDENLIMIRGPHVASGQIVNGEIRKLTDEDGWLTTKDLGRVDAGYLHYVGRADDVINCGGIKVNPEVLQERISLRLAGANRIAVSRIDDALRGDGFFVAVEGSSNADLDKVKGIAVEELCAWGIDAKSAVRVQGVSAIPRTDTGKVQRRELSKLYSGADQENPVADSLGRCKSVRELFGQVFVGVAIRDNDTFRSLGGDSLNYVQMLMLLEKHLGLAPTGWDKATVRQLESIKPRTAHSIFGWVEASVFLRAIAILGVVATHSGGQALGGGTLLLFMLIGYNMARFKAGDFLAGEVWGWIRSYAGIVVIPYFVFALLYFAWNREVHADMLLFYTNLVEARITVLFPFWFIQVLIQCLLLIGIIFSVPAWRRFASRYPTVFSGLVLAGLVGIRSVYPIVWDTDPLNDLVPPRFLAILWLGWCFYFVSSNLQRFVMMMAGIAFAFLDNGMSQSAIWPALGSVFLAFIPRVPVPMFAKRLINDVGAATFYIFALNGLIISGLLQLLPASPFLFLFLAGAIGSMSIWWMVERHPMGNRFLAWVVRKQRLGR